LRPGFHNRLPERADALLERTALDGFGVFVRPLSSGGAKGP
jgi:hypothetical protein